MLIRGGNVVDEHGVQRADVLIRDGTIAAVGPDLQDSEDILDARGKLVLPGLVDPHTHLLLDTGTARTADDFVSGSRSAAAGGVTTYLDFAPQARGEPFTETLAGRRRLIDGHTYVDFGIHLNITNLPNGWERELDRLVAAGVTSAKVYTTYRDTIFYADDWTWYQLMERSGRAGLLVQVHAENDAIVEGATGALLLEGRRSLAYHAQSRPVIAENEAVNRGLFFSQVTGSPVYFVHLSSPASVDLVAEARARGVPSLAETCPHYLVLDDSVYAGPEAARYLMTPPLRDLESQRRLWERVADGRIDSIGSDHCGFALSDRLHVDDFSQVSPGIPGVETSLLLLYSFGVVAGRLTISDIVRLLSANPAKIFGLWPRKGRIAPGADADIVLFDPVPRRTLTRAELHSQAGFSPYEGLEVTGRVMATILRGQLIYRDGEVLGRQDYGRFLPCRPFDAALALS